MYLMKHGLSIKIYIALALLALCSVFVLQNTDIVEIKFIFWRLTVSRVVLLVATTATGFVIGALTAFEIIRRK